MTFFVLVYLIWVIMRYNGELLVFCQGQNHAGLVLNVR